MVTCTGFFAPGLDFVLTQELGLSPTVNRTVIGFMGCAAMFNGLRLAAQAVEADAAARVLVVSVELCSLHSQADSRRDMLVAASLFGDGASACVVALPTTDCGEYFVWSAFSASSSPILRQKWCGASAIMAFNCTSPHASPIILLKQRRKACLPSLDEDRPRFWAIHPGGRGILDRLAQIFALDEAETRASREVLRCVGNVLRQPSSLCWMKSAINSPVRPRRGFGSQRRLERKCLSPAPQGVAMAFGPGLVIEMARLTYIGEPSRAPAQPARNETGLMATHL